MTYQTTSLNLEAVLFLLLRLENIGTDTCGGKPLCVTHSIVWKGHFKAKNMQKSLEFLDSYFFLTIIHIRLITLLPTFCVCSKRIITIASSAGSQNALHKQGYQAGTVRVLCCHCNEDFLFNVVHKTLAKCPHCGKISSVGNAFRLRQLRVYSCVALLFILITGFVIFATGFLVAESGGIVALYIGLVAISVLALVRVGYFLRMRVSKIQESV